MIDEKNFRFFPETSKLKLEINVWGIEDYRSDHGECSIKDEINKSFQKEYARYLMTGEYYPGCHLKIYRKFYRSRLCEFLKSNGLQDDNLNELSFIQSELTILKRIGFHGDYYNFLPELYAKPYRDNFKIYTKATREFLYSKVLNELQGRLVLNSEYYEIYHLPDIPEELKEQSFWNFDVTTRPDKAEINANSKTPKGFPEPSTAVLKKLKPQSENIATEIKPLEDQYVNIRIPEAILKFYDSLAMDGEEPPFVQVKKERCFFYCLRKQKKELDYFLDKGLLYDEGLNKIDSTSIDTFLEEYSKGFQKGYFEYEAKLKQYLSVFANNEEALKQRIVSRTRYVRLKSSTLKGGFRPVQENSDYEDLKKIDSTLRKFIIKREQYFENGVNGGEFFKAWEIILNNPGMFEDYFKPIKNKSLKNESERPAEFPNPVKEKKNKAEPESFEFSEDVAAILADAFITHEIVDEEKTSKDAIIESLTLDWNKTKERIHLKEIAEFVAFIDLVKGKPFFKTLTRKNIEYSKVFITPQGKALTDTNIRSSKTASKNRGTFQEKEEKMQKIVQDITSKLTLLKKKASHSGK